MSDRRRGERGLFRGCCFGLVLLLVLLGLAAFVVDRALAAPDLGGPPGGRDDGSTEALVAVSLGAQLAAQLLAAPHAVVTVSERDLTVVARVNNPNPGRYRNVEVRVRDGYVLVSTDTSYGPLSVTAVAHVSVALQQPTQGPQLVAQVMALDVGALPVPGWLQDTLVGNLAPTVALAQLFDSSPALRLVRSAIECVVVAPDGVHVGVHRPGVAAVPSVCGP